MAAHLSTLFKKEDSLIYKFWMRQISLDFFQSKCIIASFLGYAARAAAGKVKTKDYKTSTLTTGF